MMLIVNKMRVITIVRKPIHNSMNISDLVTVPRRLISKTASSSTRWSGISHSRFYFLIRKIRWFHVPVTFAFTLITLGQLRKYRLRKYEQNETDNQLSAADLYRPSHLEVSMYKMLPLRTLSRIWGWINSFELPVSIRSPILRSYARAFGCDLNEASVEDLMQYKNLGEFFRRSLKPGLRPIYGDENSVVSPSDGTILHMGSAKNGLLEQVKGITYTIESFLGPNTWKSGDSLDSNRQLDYQKALLHNYKPEATNNPTDLYYCVIYLAPGDYHRFHSPANWKVNFRRHFPGKLYSVRPTFASWFPNLFAVNERVAYIGEWKHGFFAMAPVGATNVGSMNIYFDKELKTNKSHMRLKRDYEDKIIDGIELKKGEPFGEFNLGSTIVLIFEAPTNVQLNIKQGMKIKYGELISTLEPSKYLLNN